MTEPSQYFKGRTVQEQMNEVIGYVDVRAEEVAAAKADDVLQPAEDAKDAAIQAKDLAVAAQDAAEDAQAAAEQAVTDAAAVLANAVKKTGETSQNINGSIGIGGDLNVAGNTTVATVATGTFDTKAVNGTKLKNEMDNYGSLLRTGGFQTASPKEFSGSNPSIITSVGWNGGVNLKQTVGDLAVGQANGLGASIRWLSQDGLTDVGHLVMTTDAQGNAVLLCILKDKNGTNKYITIASSA